MFWYNCVYSIFLIIRKVHLDSFDFDKIYNYLRNNFIYVDTSNDNIIGFGKSYFIDKSKTDCVKLDLYYTDKFINPPLINLSSI